MRAVQAVISAGLVASTGTTTFASPSTPTNASGSIVVNNQTFNIASGLTLDQVVASINSQAQGSGVSAKAVLDNSGAYHLQISNGMNAMTVTDNAGFGLSNASPPPQTQLVASLQQALTTANAAENDLGNLQQNISNSSNQLSAAHDQQTSFVTYLQNSLSNVKDVDTAQAASKVQQYQAQLQASYLAVSTLTKISLAQYL
jgi:flagellar hook-associated protein 3 FlgL